MAALVVVPNLALTIIVLIAAGAAWLAVLSTVNATLQLFLPSWVRARGLAVYMIVLFGSQAIGAAAWGAVAGEANLTVAFGVAALLMMAGVVVGLRWPLRDVSGVDRSSATPWPEARLAFEPDPDVGPVLVTTEYVVEEANAEKFIAVMDQVGRARLRTGATTWSLLRDGAQPDHFLETFEVPTWDIHLRQHGGRLTGYDAELERRAEQLVTSTSEVRHYFPADAMLDEEPPSPARPA